MAPFGQAVEIDGDPFREGYRMYVANLFEQSDQPGGRSPHLVVPVKHRISNARHQNSGVGEAAKDTNPTTPDHAAVRIVPYDTTRLDHREAFRDLNLAWIEAHFAVEARDRYELDDPETHIISVGGQIFMAEGNASGAGSGAVDVLGTCALLAEPDGIYELAKMAVVETARGRGVGRALGEAVITAARALGATRVELLSNTVLGPAISLYRALGFVEVPLPETDYARANIKMVLELYPGERGPSARYDETTRNQRGNRG